MIDLAEAIRDAHGVADIAALDRARGQLPTCCSISRPDAVDLAL
jgi:hypothetical protein